MPNSTVVFLGNITMGTIALEDAAGHFGWSVEAAKDFNHLQELRLSRNVVAIIFDAESLGLTVNQALGLARTIAPQAQLIPCFRFSEVVNWPELAEAGAFHALALPLHPSEVRQSLGFVWSARLRRNANVVPLRAASERRRETTGEAVQLRDAS
jgi:DNA-binding NtrC family response regulator